ncbi:hypothetical protein [Campylobacter ureolyticus]|uniref:JHP0747 family n=1 Tax=Campylobacter ureolyticus TaxID=827 RepID=A0AAE7EAJ5_9BACT|nr:hypothetical protein [Campylobacter ureolyticus]MCR8685170.1 hypothetical protein [Campylobacter ureolyticus]QKF84648.1 hypothetical protein CURT_1179 [Campylobacter ureolyticus]QQY35184.1 hypothetical protein I6I59_06595 [Campylobacter ureolyticus]SUX21806.1 JHP0747 family [Campylobacter ureolyticus]
MKIAINCECLIMQKTLEIFLKDYLADEEEADFIVSDINKKSNKRVFYIGDDSPYLALPFSKKDLLYALEEFDFIVKDSNLKENLEDKIALLCDEFKLKLIKTIREYQ